MTEMGMPGLSLSWIAERDVKTPSSSGSDPERLKFPSSSTATDCERALAQPPDNIAGVVAQQLIPYLPTLTAISARNALHSPCLVQLVAFLGDSQTQGDTGHAE